MPAFVLDLDGTLVDSVYYHALSWHTALRDCGFELPFWRIHRKIGMSGALLIDALALELGRSIDEATGKRLEQRHSEEFARLRPQIRPFAGAREFLDTLEEHGVRYAIATSGKRDDIGPLLELVGIGKNVPVVTKEDAPNPKPDPALFLKAAEQIGGSSEETLAVGDSVWDMLAARRAHFLGIGLLTGGYAESEMTAAGAFRVYADPEQLRAHLHETGVHLKESR